MLLNSELAEVAKQNATRLVRCVNSKNDLVYLATATSFEQFFSALETILVETEMFFDEDFLCCLDSQSWRSFKAILLVYTLNSINRQGSESRNSAHVPHYIRQEDSISNMDS